ncbi:MAG: hypothetical protein H7X97_02885, partial [Opitutaceae bacterium]|nr:hypothetical protein [Verrucomicrobiales bacterium]
MPPDPATGAEDKAVAFLTREVPAWSRENGCFSCHNNGDAARALLAATRHGHNISVPTLADTMAWVSRSEKWAHNQGDPGFSDQRLANLQFATALLAAIETGFTKDREALLSASRLVATDQDPDGAWNIERQNPVGSPATWGTTLATRMAVRILRAADATRHRAAILKAEQWLRLARPVNVPVAAVLLMASSDATHALSAGHQGECLALIRRAQTSDGGWGPYVDSPAESFDTALVLLALAESRSEPGVVEMIRRGRAFLVAEQFSDGSWPATTRPSG